MIVLLLWACAATTPASAPPEATTSEPTTATATTSAPDTTTPATAADATAFDRSCSADADCAVVMACAGLADVPADPASARCGDLCWTAVHAGDAERWAAACGAVDDDVPCDKKFAKCEPASEKTSVCVSGTCRVR